MTSITQGSAMSPVAAYAYDDLGRRTSVARGNGVSTAYGYDPASRLTSLAHDLAGTANDNAYGYAHNPSGQIVTLTSANTTALDPAQPSGTTPFSSSGQWLAFNRAFFPWLQKLADAHGEDAG